MEKIESILDSENEKLIELSNNESSVIIKIYIYNLAHDYNK